MREVARRRPAGPAGTEHPGDGERPPARAEAGEPAAASLGPRRAAGLVLASLAVMVGLVFAANLRRYGAPGLVGGLFLVATGLFFAARLFQTGR